jgi:membrane protein YqaA with SNARE-associated domain
MHFLITIFGSLMSWWGLAIIAFFDASVVFFLPLVVDIGVIILSSRSHEMFWLFPIVATIGFVAGATVTYYIGRAIGVAGLEHFVPRARLAGIRRRIEGKGAVALALASLIPPPFPFTAAILTAGALKVRLWVFLTTLGCARLLLYGAESVLAYFYGRRIIRWLESDIVEYIGALLFAAAVIGTAVTAIRLFRKTRSRRRPRKSRAA